MKKFICIAGALLLGEAIGRSTMYYDD